jgi:hypothetical protein
MKLAAAQSLVAWLWDQHPALVNQLARQIPAPRLALGALGQCFSCDLDILTSSSCDGSSYFSSGVCLGTSDPTLSIDPSSLDASSLNLTCLAASCSLDTIGLDSSTCIPTLTCADLTPVSTSAVTGGCNVSIGCCTSINSSAAATSSGLSNVASYVASGVAGLSALAKVAAAYFNAQAAGSAAAASQARTQAAIVAAQTARASTGHAALPITYVANGATGTSTPMISTTGGLLPLTNSMLSALTPASLSVFFAQYGTWLLIGGAAAFLAYAATRRRAT